ncbi:hypothetical protein C8Q76DRAFT_789923 [Earliella scabrosa]|nr:hypothetical protein C8Q76DRAFT_789923 [Earliella scabrosa]
MSSSCNPPHASNGGDAPPADNSSSSLRALANELRMTQLERRKAERNSRERMARMNRDLESARARGEEISHHVEDLMARLLAMLKSTK